jgi:glyoxylase-like metal-dependent hydrolase (beta-lactamase superfamily II)
MEFVPDRVFEVGPGVFIRNAVDNCVWADLGDGVVTIDALEDPNMAPVIQEDIRKTVGKPFRWLINTHWHGDHIACNPAWAKAGATVIAHESCGGPTTAHDGQPNVTFQDRYTLQGSERQVELEWLGGTHTPWDSVVYFPWAKVLHIADLFGWGMLPLLKLEWEKVPRMKQVLNRVLEYDAQTLLCGHGPILQPTHIRRWLAYFDELLERVPKMVKEGRSLAEIEDAFPPPEDMRDWWRFVDWKHARNLKLVAEASA